MTDQRQWWKEKGVFEDFKPVIEAYPRKATNLEVRYLISHLNLVPRKSFLDCPCGTGRLALPLARAGIKVTGVDITESYLEELQKKAARRGLRLTIVPRDMRRIDFENEFDAAANMGTSFGFFERESDNLLVLKKLFKALKPGGRLLVHVINRDFILSHYTTTGWSEVKGITVLEKRSFDYTTSINRGTLQFVKNGKTRTHLLNLRMYSCHELITMFRSVGFDDIRGFGTLRDAPIDKDKRMMLIFGTKPRTAV